ncbi:MAG: SDR family NAD(P)-dependent oxidoreductase [Alphaproteobacteria bacterium]
MSFRIFLTIFHDLIIFIFSFFLALLLRLELQLSLELFSSLWVYSIGFSIMNIIILNFLGLYHGIWRYASIHEINSIFKSVSISTFSIIVVIFLTTRLEGIPRSFPIILIIISIFNSIGPRLLYRIIKDYLGSNSTSQIPTLLVGDSSSSENFIRHTKTDKNSPYRIISIISLKEKSVGRRIHNIPIVGSLENFKGIKFNILDKLKKPPERIIVSDQNIEKDVLEDLFIFAKNNGLAIGQINKVSNISITKNSFDTSPIVIEDVLGRKQNVNDTSKLVEFRNKTILITGAGGSIGSELSRQILSLQPKNIILLDNNEFSLFKISSELKNKCTYTLSDIRDKIKIDKILAKLKPDFVFHAAALKHISFVEEDPYEAIKTNFLATVSLCKLCIKYKIKKFVFISTDKAVYPSNIMGASKRLCEKFIQQIAKSESGTNFSIVRFGNVLGSTGSVVPIFENQINLNTEITITHPKVKRYFMTIREAVELVLISSQIKNSKNGNIFILEMGKPVFIKDLAKKMVSLSGKDIKSIKIKYTGLRKGEKLDELLFFSEEKITKTEINGILCTTTRSFQTDMQKFEDFIKKASTNKNEALIEDIIKILPEYKRLG